MKGCLKDGLSSLYAPIVFIMSWFFVDTRFVLASVFCERNTNDIPTIYQQYTNDIQTNYYNDRKINHYFLNASNPQSSHPVKSAALGVYPFV
jgi:hypothetical protein